MITSIKAQQFMMLFRGNTHSYVKNVLPLTVEGKGTKIKTRITQERGAVDVDLLSYHLNGEFGVGVCPVNTEGKCYFGVIDIDYYGDKLSHIFNILREYQIPLIPFRSKSGGLHLYLMVSRAVSAREMRNTLLSFVTMFSLEEFFGKGKVEIFPKQEKITQDGFGSAVTLPYFNAEEAYTFLYDLDGNKVEFDGALLYIQKHLTTLKDFSEAMSVLPYDDAPPCIQRILLSGTVGTEDSGRNNFLFSYALYASKKFGEEFETHVAEINETFASPLSENVVQSICNSIRTKEYCYKCKDIPCTAYCNKMECKKREYGLGMDKGHFSDVEYGKLYRYKSAEPYYVWELRMQGSEAPFKRITFHDENDLLDQKVFAKSCVRYLNFAPKQVKANDWFETLNKYLKIVEDVEISIDSDTSSLAHVKQMFNRYLANKQARRDCPYQIRANLCVRKEFVDADTGLNCAKVYFTSIGFAEYLRMNKVAFDQTLLREVLQSFGAREDVLEYISMTGLKARVPCWSKIEDEQIKAQYEMLNEIALQEAKAVTDASNGTIAHLTQEKPYSDSDKAKAMQEF